MKTVFITGASSGIGKEAAKYFQRNKWNVIAAMRRPDLEKDLISLDNVKIISCDVSDEESIKSAVCEGIQAFGAIDVLVNNAGYYILGPVEGAAAQQINGLLNTNLAGLIHTTKEMLPHFRQRGKGMVINISSIAGIVALPLQSVYHASKWGVEGFSESLRYELKPFNISVKIVEPGLIKTDFYGRSMTLAEAPEEYKTYSEKVMKNILESASNGSSPSEVAQVIYRAATDESSRLRYSVGQLKNIIPLRKLLPQRVFSFLAGFVMERS